MQTMRDLLAIFTVSARVGAMTFGGGYAMLPILQKEVVERKKWATETEVLDYYALAQCLPGIIMVNTLAFIGQKKKGAAGSIAGGLGAVAPALIIITLIAALLTSFSDVPMVQNAFAGIRVCVCVLVFNSVVKLWKSSIVDRKCFAIFCAVAVLSLFSEISPIFLVIVSGALGVALSCFGEKK